MIKWYDQTFDAALLEREYRRVSNQISGPFDQGRLRITYSDLDNENAPPNFACSNTPELIELRRKAELSFFDTWKAGNILKPFQRTYTENVVKQLDAFLRQEGLRVTVAKYSTLKSCQALVMHVDQYLYRFHVPVQTSENSFMIVEGQLYNVGRLGQLFRLQSNTTHTAINADSSDRIHLVLDVTDSF